MHYKCLKMFFHKMPSMAMVYRKDPGVDMTDDSMTEKGAQAVLINLVKTVAKLDLCKYIKTPAYVELRSSWNWIIRRI